MPGTDPAPPKSAFPDQGDTDADIKQEGGQGQVNSADQAAAAPSRFEPPADPATSNPNTSSPTKVSSSSSATAAGSSTTARKSAGDDGQGVQVTDNPMLFGEKVKALHRAIDEFVNAVRTDEVPGVGGESSGPEKVVQRLKAWKEESAAWQSGKSKL